MREDSGQRVYIVSECSEKASLRRGYSAESKMRRQIRNARHTIMSQRRETLKRTCCCRFHLYQVQKQINL